MRRNYVPGSEEIHNFEDFEINEMPFQMGYAHIFRNKTSINKCMYVCMNEWMYE